MYVIKSPDFPRHGCRWFFYLRNQSPCTAKEIAHVATTKTRENLGNDILHVIKECISSDENLQDLIKNNLLEPEESSAYKTAYAHIHSSLYQEAENRSGYEAQRQRSEVVSFLSMICSAAKGNQGRSSGKSLRRLFQLLYPLLMLANAADSFLSKSGPNPKGMKNQIAYLKGSGNAKTFFLMFIIAVFLLLFWMNIDSYFKKYKSDLQSITPDIETPVAVGEHQYGSSRWLKPSEFKQAFTPQSLGKSDPYVRYLRNIG